MIISFPTALYDPLLPKKNTDSQSVTFLISSNNPPRATQNTQQLPFVEAIKPLPAKVYDLNAFRQVLGDFVFNVSQSNEIDIGSSKKQFEAGQTLDFGSSTTLSISQNTVPDSIELRQDTNILDLTDMGLSSDDIELLTNSAEDQFNETVGIINEYNSEIKKKEMQVREDQKSLNETKKVISVAEVIFASSGTSEAPDILKKLEQNEQELTDSINTLVSEINTLNTKIQEEFKNLLKLRELVR